MCSLISFLIIFSVLFVETRSFLCHRFSNGLDQGLLKCCFTVQCLEQRYGHQQLNMEQPCTLFGNELAFAFANAKKIWSGKYEEALEKFESVLGSKPERK